MSRVDTNDEQREQGAERVPEEREQVGWRLRLLGAMERELRGAESANE